jgi:uroporphyrinogen decarboxylase
MGKREHLLNLLEPGRKPGAVPAAFFLHFPPGYHFSQAAVDKHLEYFRATDMDFVKIQYERNFPVLEEIRRPEDWVRMPHYDREFFEPQLAAVKGLVQAASGEALVVLTLYSPFMCAGHTSKRVVDHLRVDPEKVRPGLEAITESLLWFVRECIRLGVDGFYASTQGGERGRFDDPAIFRDYIKPYDLAVMNAANAACPFNILHVCDYAAPYDDLSPFLDYPGQVVSYPLAVGGRPLTAAQVAASFGRPAMGGFDRHGILAYGTPDEIRTAARDVLAAAPERFILGADCTLASDVPWANLRTAIDTAHAYRR